ncbi:MAG: GDSL-type esterase/lipase family protein [Prevotellaceae bacterium]|jgi:lysophospholipase L1-like esterase|nr:GDSL-type esterase/lipase family protein [Prevotellaceae bacterium]
MKSTFFTSKIKFIVLLHIFFIICTGFLFSHSNPDNDDDNTSLRIANETIMPPFFTGTQINIIQDSTHSLFPFFEKLMMIRDIKNIEKPVVRIVHIGDSHVRSHRFTPALNFRLTEIFGNAATGFIDGYKSSGIVEENGLPGIVSHCIGINGATSKNFLDDKYINEVRKLNPDLIIISLGTNESLGRYDSLYHYNMMENLFSLLKEECPNSTILYTTPPGAFKTKYSRARRRRNRKIISVTENNTTKNVASTIMQFAADHNVACWDLFNIAGGDKYACKNWLDGNYYQNDKLHFIVDGYELHGNLLYEALITSYNEYILSRYEHELAE